MIEPFAANDSVFRCGWPSRSVREWLARHGSEDLRIATYGVSRYASIGHFVPRGTSLELLVGISGIDPLLVGDLHQVPEQERWHRLLNRLGTEERNHLLRNLRKLNGWSRRGAQVRIALPGQTRGLMHLKLYLGKDTALIGSANFTLQAIEGADQHELLVELAGKPVIQLQEWWRATWAIAWPVFAVGGSQVPTVRVASNEVRVHAPKETAMSSGPQKLLGYWLGEWGAWALNGNGMIAYPHQLQAVEWIRPDGRAYLLGDEVGLGKTFSAAFLWIRHRQLYGNKARLIYITKPSLLVDALSAFVTVLGVDEFLQTAVEIPQRTGDVNPRFSIFHANTRCWEMVADDDGRKRNKDHQVAGLLKEGRFRMRPAAFQEKIQWLSAIAANKLHEQITITAVKALVDSDYTFVSIDTLRNPDNPLALVFTKLDEAGLVPLVIVDESHGLGRETLRRGAIADLVWGPRDHVGKPPILQLPGALVVYMTGTPVHPNESETASRLGLLDVDPTRTPHKPVLYEDARSPATRAILDQVRDRAVIRRKEGITLDGKPNGLRIFPKRLVFPFQKWMPLTGKDVREGLPKEIAKASKDILLAIDQFVASEASHGAKLFSLIRRVLRSARDWKEIRQLIKDNDSGRSSGEDLSFGERVLRLSEQQIKTTTGDQQTLWKALRMALEAARDYEEKLKDDRLENLTWKRGRDDDGNDEKQMLFTKAGWIATAYDSLAKGGKKAALDAAEEAAGDVPEEDEETAGELFGSFDSADDMLKDAERAKRLAETYLDPVLLDDDSKVRFSMLVALLEGIASLKLWPRRYPSMGDEDRFGWGIEDVDQERLRKALEQVHSECELRDPWVVHARYIHSVVDTAVRLQLRYGREAGVPIVGIIIGDTPNQKRDEIKERFSKGELNIVCMSDAGAEGINLQRSNKIVLLDVPVSPGRIEQIAGRVHRLGSVRAAQVTLLLPPGYFGTKVFEALRKAASNVFKMAAGSNLPTRPEAGAEQDAYYVRQLAEYEARLLTAVAETSGVIRSEENRGALEELVSEPEQQGQAPNTASIEKVLKSGFDLIQEQRLRFQQGVATHSDLMPEVSDLVDALVKFEGATTTASSDSFRVPIQLIDDRTKPDEYGDLVTRPEPFQTLQLKNEHRYWYGPQRFLPTDLPTEANFQWLGVIGNKVVSELLVRWRREQLDTTDEQRLRPQIWISTTVPKGKAIAFCGITNEFMADGTPATSPGERALHVLVGLAETGEPRLTVEWRPFYARGASIARHLACKDTFLPIVIPKPEERWAAKLIRRVTGLEHGCDVRNTDSKTLTDVAERIRNSLIKEKSDEDENTKSWRLVKDPVKLWLDSNAPGWWVGGVRLGCKPRFCLIAFGDE